LWRGWKNRMTMHNRQKSIPKKKEKKLQEDIHLPVNGNKKCIRQKLVPERVLWWYGLGAGKSHQILVGGQVTEAATVCTHSENTAEMIRLETGNFVTKTFSNLVVAVILKLFVSDLSRSFCFYIHFQHWYFSKPVIV